MGIVALVCFDPYIVGRVIAEHIVETVPQAILLWDHALFFEVHDLLEHEWMRAEGKQKEMLQALIRAAGVYVHLARGNVRGAEKMAAKAVVGLVKHRDSLPAEIDLDLLLSKLQNRDKVPPLLGKKSRTGQ